ncbi:hypothetical protein LINPERHAP1_LOCUS13011 [Linum perenne]
MLLNDVLVF